MSDDILSAIAALDTKLSTQLSTQIAALDTKLTTQLGGLQHDLQSVLSRVGNLDSRVGRLEHNVANLKGSVFRLESSVANIEDSMGTMRESEVSMLGYFNTLQASMADMRRLMVQHQEDAIVPLGIAERAERTALSAREEGRLTASVVSSLIRQVRALRARVDALTGLGEGGKREVGKPDSDDASDASDTPPEPGSPSP